MPESEYANWHAEYVRKNTKPVTEVTHERFWDMLEVLPPCKWITAGSEETFHVSERLWDNHVSWFTRIGERYFECTDIDTRRHYEIVARVREYIAANPDTGETLASRYAVYRDNAQALGWSVKNFDEWLNT
jgi:hypothetical protein